MKSILLNSSIYTSKEITLVVVVVVVVGFIHYNLKHGYFYVDYSIELNVGNGKKHELMH